MTRLSEPDALVKFSTRIGMRSNKRTRLLKEEFTTLNFLLGTYHNTENLQKLLKNLNKAFRSITRATDKSYFPTTIMRHIFGAPKQNIRITGTMETTDSITLTRGRNQRHERNSYS